MRRTKFSNFIDCTHSSLKVSVAVPMFPFDGPFIVLTPSNASKSSQDLFQQWKRCIGCFFFLPSNPNIFHIKGAHLSAHKATGCVCVPPNDYVLSWSPGIGKLSPHTHAFPNSRPSWFSSSKRNLINNEFHADKIVLRDKLYLWYRNARDNTGIFCRHADIYTSAKEIIRSGFTVCLFVCHHDYAKISAMNFSQNLLETWGIVQKMVSPSSFFCFSSRNQYCLFKIVTLRSLACRI